MNLGLTLANNLLVLEDVAAMSSPPALACAISPPINPTANPGSCLIICPISGNPSPETILPPISFAATPAATTVSTGLTANSFAPAAVNNTLVPKPNATPLTSPLNVILPFALSLDNSNLLLANISKPSAKNPSGFGAALTSLTGGFVMNLLISMSSLLGIVCCIGLAA